MDKQKIYFCQKNKTTIFMIHCNRCGEPNNDYARFCSRCGTSLIANDSSEPASPQQPESQGQSKTPSLNEIQQKMYEQRAQMPDTYLWQSIVVTILCCLPLGIGALINSTQVESRFMRGDIVGAQNASRYAKNFCIASLVSVLVIAVIYWILILFGIFAGGFNEIFNQY